MQAVGGNSDSRLSRFGDRSYKPSVHNYAKLTGAEYIKVDMSASTSILLSSLLIASLLLEKLSESLKNDITTFGRAIGHVCEVVGEYLFAAVTGLLIYNLIDRLLE